MFDTFADAPTRAGFKPRRKGDFPTLGYLALDWMTTYLSRPTVTYHAPFEPTREQAEFLLKWYRLDPITGERVYRRGVIQRSKGWGKAEYLGNLVPTPRGYRRFGDLKVGDYVFGSDGKPTRVIQVHPAILDYGYQVTGSDGYSATFHGNHTFVATRTTLNTFNTREFSVSEMAAIVNRHKLDKLLISKSPGKKATVITLDKFERTSRPVLMRCITVEAKDGQYLTGTAHWVTHNSPFLAAIAAFEALGPCRFAGWDAEGQPVGQPWNVERKVEITLLAVSEEQTRNAFEPMKEMMNGDNLLYAYPGVEVLETRILLPYNGLIMPRTSSARSLEGKPQLFTIADQTETWVPSNGGDRLGAVAKRNLSKVDGTLLEAPNAFVPGEGSFAETTWEAWQKGRAGETYRDNILYDSRDWGDPDLNDPSSIVAGLEYAYGDSLKSPTGCKIHTPPCGVNGSPYPGGWVNINGVLDDVFDPATTLSDAARYFGNKPHASADAFVPYEVLTAATVENLEAEGIDAVTRHDPVVVGFDGSWGRSRGVTDATAIVAMRVSDGLSWAVRVWEQPDNAQGRDWEPPRAEIDDIMRRFIQDFNVVDGLFDPAGWEALAAEWESLIQKKRNGSRRANSAGFGTMLWRGNQLNKVAEATKALRIALYEKEVMLTGPNVLVRHLTNAQYRETRAGKIMYKESPSSARKIDAAYALMLAYQSKLRVSSKGYRITPARPSAAPMRLR
nr:MAG TPA: Large Terminase [Caudoviricetes sp.]